VSRFDVLSVDSFTAVVLIMIRAFTYGQDVQNGISALNEFLPFIDTMDRFHARLGDEVPNERQVLPADLYSVRAEDLHFSFPDRPPLLAGLSLEFTRGRAVGIIGPSGAGKTTLIQILLGLIEPTRGRFFVNGREMAFDEYRATARKIAFVPQSTQLFAASIKDNILFFRDDPGASQLDEVIERAMLSNDIAHMPNGLLTNVGISGNQLSGGQRQRIAIARALLEVPSMLILDEPTSSLDATARSGILSTLEVLKREVGLIVVTHSNDLKPLFDEVIEI